MDGEPRRDVCRCGDVEPHPDVCGCCEAELPPPSIFNPPGLPALRYRLGTQPEFLRRMLEALPRQTTPGGTGRPLADLGTRSTDDPAIGLLDAWAVVADVLTFYQERTANEGFLGTATERRSVVELARTIGYEPRPGVAASTFLAFTVDGGTDPAATATVPAGTRVQSVPSQGGLPQTFQTSEDFTGRSGWNELRPLSRQVQVVDPAVSPIYVEGLASGVNAGDLLLFVDVAAGGAVTTGVKRVQAVTDERELSRVRVDLQDPLQHPEPVLYAPGVFATAFLQATPLESGAVGTFVLGGSWKEEDLSAFVEIQGWDRSALEATVAASFGKRSFATSSSPGALPPPEAGVFAFGQRAGVFGNTAPHYGSLPASMRTDTDAAYPASWDDGSHPITQASDGGVYTAADFFLERVVDGVVAGSWVVLEDPSAAGSEIRAYRVEETVQRAMADFAISARTTGVKVREPGGTEPGDLDDFGMRSTTVHGASARLPLATLPIETNIGRGTAEEIQLTLDRLVLGLKKGQPVIVNGERADLAGVQAIEAVVLADIVHSSGLTTLFFEDALENVYVRSSATVTANVVRATHGETVREVMGSGDAGSPNQRFALKRPPLTFLSAPTARGSESTLVVRVNGVEWKEVPSLYPLGPRDEGYVIRMDEAATSVTFGDGRRGARLPTGAENVEATYRSGLGLSGQVPAGSLTLLQTRPPGVRAVANPVPATGAADPESLDDARSNAPLTVLTMDRIVSLRDYEDFARAFAGIGKAQAVELWQGERSFVHVTVAGADGSAVLPSSELYGSLVDAIEASGDPVRAFQVDSYQKVYFDLGGSVRIDPRYRPEAVLDAVGAALVAGFSFAARRFGQPVSAAEAVTVIQGVEGVEAVDLDALYRVEDAASPPPPSLSTVLISERARLHGNGVLPAQLLLVNPVGITLTEMVV